MVVLTWNPSIGKQRQENKKFKVILNCIESLNKPGSVSPDSNEKKEVGEQML